MTTYLRQDQATISVTGMQRPDGRPIGLPFVSSWATLEGGDLESEDTKTRPGGMVTQVNLGGPTMRTDATVMRPYSREIHPFLTVLENSAGRSPMKIHFAILDAWGQTFSSGQTVTLHGILKNVKRPDWNANTTGTAELALVMGCNVEATTSQ